MTLIKQKKEIEKNTISTETLQKGLPKIVDSLCPECKKVIKAKIFEKDKQVWMEKTCPKHGYVKDLIYSNVDLYLRMERLHYDYGKGIITCQVKDSKNCPNDCGLCNNHKSSACMVIVDLTNRCNLNCPICFANANARGYVYEPTIEQIKGMLEVELNVKPNVCSIVQFSGGEPTLYPQFLEIVKETKKMGFKWVQIATNGIKIANSLEFTKKCKEAGLDALYLQFDGFNDNIYKKNKGVPLVEIKKKAIGNARKAGIGVTLVPTIVKGVNDDQLGKIVRFAIENKDIIDAVSFQPISFTGRFPDKERMSKRYTIADAVDDISRQTGITETMRDWFPLSMVSPFSKLISFLSDEEAMNLTNHPHCGIGTYLIINKKRETTPISKFLNLEKIMKEIDELIIKKNYSKTWLVLRTINILRKNFNKKEAPEGLTFFKFLKSIKRIYGDQALDSNKKIINPEWKIMVLLGMHFQDCYNFDTERVRRCIVHYLGPNGKIYPFCTYNSGPFHRQNIEEKYAL